MIAFGTAITNRDVYEEVALPGIRRVAESDSLVLTREGHDSIQRPYNDMLDAAAGESGLEALVLLHQDLELIDGTLPERIRRAFDDPCVGLLGALGGRGSRLHCWLAPDEVFGFAIGPDQADIEEPRLSTGPHKVDGLDGAVLIVAPWVVRGLRFSEALAPYFHGYDVDISTRVRQHGGRVLCEDIACRHHMTWKHDYERQQAAGMTLARLWDPCLRPAAWQAAFQV